MLKGSLIVSNYESDIAGDYGSSCNKYRRCSMNYIKVFIFAILIVGCTNRSGQNVHENEVEFYTIDIEQCLGTEQTVLMSDIADTVEYIVLKTPDEVVITGIRQVIPYGDYLFIRARGVIYKFRKDGQFVRQIGARGQGPGEYLIAASFFIDPQKKEIVVGEPNQLLYYSIEGNYLRHISRQFSEFALSDSLIWIANYPGHWEKFEALSLTTTGDTVSSIPNKVYGTGQDNGYQVAVTSRMSAPFYHYNGHAFYKGFDDNDTIRKLSGAQATPYAFIDFGKYKLPLEYSPGTSGFATYGYKYLGVPFISEDADYFFFAPENRATGVSDFCLYNKKSKCGFIVTDENGQGITDNILGGPNIKLFWITGEYKIGAIEGYQLLESMEQGEYSPIPAFKKQLSGINDDTNQLIILCRNKQSKNK